MSMAARCWNGDLRDDGFDGTRAVATGAAGGHRPGPCRVAGVAAGADLEGQRWRRSRMRRIDYCPSQEAAAVIDCLRTRRAGGDASSILNRIIAEWADTSGIK